MIVDVAEMLDEMDMGPLELERRTARVQNARGAYEEQAPAIVVLSPVVWHTLTGRDLERVPEASRTKGVRTFYARERFFVDDAGQDADVIRCEGRRYRVIKVHDYASSGGVWIADAELEDRS